MSSIVAATAAARGGRRRWPSGLGWLLLLAIGLASVGNAWHYTETNANPVIIFDAWYFADVFVAKQAEGTLTWRDFFAKRDSSDHSQPLHKLWLAANTRWFGLDFRFDALVAFGGLVLCVLVFVGLGLSALRARRLTVLDGLALSALPLVMFSLNSPEIYEWPLVTQYYLALPFALALFAVAALSRRGRAWPLAIVAFAALLVIDSGGLLALIATALVIALRGSRGGTWAQAWPALAALVFAVLVYRMTWWWLMPPVPQAAGMLHGVSALIAEPATLWKLFAIPATSSWVHWDTLFYWFESPQRVTRAVAIIGAAVVVLHACFWVSIWRTLAQHPVAAFAAMLMLYVYGMWAGVVLSRVPESGADYLWQHRYIAFFHLANVALILQWVVASAARLPPPPGSRWRWRWQVLIPVPAIAALVWLQWALADRAWYRSPYVLAGIPIIAAEVYCIGAHPDAQAQAFECSALHPVCDWPQPVRAHAVAALREHRLNVYDPGFIARYDLDPASVDLNACLLPPTN